MNKETFLKELMKKLSILSEEEKEDIRLEYQDIIEEKVKHGKTEEEAVKEFGNINDLSKEILKVYKINPNYKKDNTKSFINDVEDAIKVGAKKLTEVTEDVASNIKDNNDEVSLTKIFELLIKFFLILMGLFILKLPFELVEDVGLGIFESSRIFGSNLICDIWSFIIEMVYLLICIIVIISCILKITKNKDKKIIEDNHPEKKVESNETKKEKKEEVKYEIKEEKNEKHTISSLFILIIKMFIVMTFLFPLWGMSIGLTVGLCVLIYLVFKGLYLVGPIILLIGGLIICYYLSSIAFKGLFNKIKVHFYPFIISFILIVIGSLMTMDYIAGFTYYNYLPKTNFKTKTITYEKNIKEPTQIENNADYIIDNKLKDNKIRVEVNYYSDFITIDDLKLEKIECDDCDYSSTLFVSTSDVEIKEFSFNNKVVKLMMENLKKQKIYKYYLFDEPTIKIYTNKKTRELLK